MHHLIGSSTMEYVRDLQGRVVSEVLPSGGLNASYLYFGGSMVGEYAAGTTYFFHQDHLGSTRLVTAYPTPTIVECDDFYPYGEANANVGGCLSNTYTQYKFTGDERDIETNLDHTWFRQDSSTLGRWMSPDPAGLAAVDPAAPQSWNRYAYVLNSPLNFVDPTGQCIDYNGIYSDTNGNVVIHEDVGPCNMLQPWLLTTNYACVYNGTCSFIGAPSTGGGGGGGGGNSSGYDWSVFWYGVLHGVRQPGQSFAACVADNANQTTFGAHKAVIGAVVATASAAAADAVQVQVLPNEPPVSGALNIALYAGRFVFLASGALISGKTVIAPIAIGIRAAARAAPYVAAAEAGLLIGSAINCR